DMSKLFKNYVVPDLSKSRFTKLPPLFVSARTRSVIQANIAADLDPGGVRINKILSLAKAEHTEAFVLPPAAVMRLSAQQRVRFMDALYDGFDLRLNIGGDDVHPKLYGQPITHARTEELNETRDFFELMLIRHWQKRNDKAIKMKVLGKPEFGICRGHQLMGVASGHTMNQDVVRDGVSRDGTHLDRLGDPSKRTVQHWHHIYVEQGFFAELLGKSGDVRVNDWHHQSVRPNPRGRTYVVAVAPDGVVEAMESKDRLTVSVQFHPEFDLGQSGNPEFTNMGRSFFRRLFDYARGHRVLRECSAVFAGPR
ncbi:MAG: gamma-glutamyl-gamma-aminobutyrate hydrolase family protein, partial [Bdellovibrionota bacterium]